MDKKPLSIGQIAEIEINGISHQGHGIGRLHNFAVFVQGALPKEKVKVSISSIKKNYAKADLLEILSPCAERVETFCPYYDSCGGCHLMHSDYKAQLAIKESLVASALRKIGHFNDIVILPILPSPMPLYYRNRCQLHCLWQDGQLLLGFFEPKSHRLCEIESCSLLAPVLNDILADLPSYLQQWAANLSMLKQIDLRTDYSFSQVFVNLVFESIQDEQQLKEMAEDLLLRFTAIKSVSAQVKKGKPYWIHLAGVKYIEEKISGLSFSHAQGSFLQINPSQTENLYAVALDFAAINNSQTVIDLYCGIGTISLLLARKAQQVVAVEEFAPAIEQANMNAIINDINNIRFITGKAEEVLPELLKEGLHANVIVLDPPRSGCDKTVIDTALAMNAERIIYISCDPATMSRDLRLFCGYRVEKVQPVDMFPQTCHVECVILMQRSGLKDKK
ncbi:MAG: 23S rRNA (uracil(1939)-C(5))-methyltransferase RlmD [Bacillota bacterium]|jgi:23S rRNA (uracil1939-C5)-methyltransferase